MITIVETPSFKQQVDKVWSEDERLDFIQWIALNPEFGDVIPKSDGARKVRWSIKGSGKRGGVRVIYFNQLNEGLLYLVAIYKKSKQSNMSSQDIKKRLNDEH
jgi:mRNA-degrading endonuclease RelE of RelBE toxin-antitoxin system